MTTNELTRPTRQGGFAATGLLALLTVGTAVSLTIGGAGVSAASTDTVQVAQDPTETIPDTTVATTPGTSLADSQPSPDSLPSTEQDADDGDLPPVTWIALIGGGALLAVAIWWMLRRPDDETGAPSDPDWPTGTNVT
jgi:hypothetical protein